MTPSQAIAEAKKGALRPVYVVAGEEHFLRDQVTVALRESALGAGIAAFNEDKFQAGETDVEKIIAAARTVPMMAPRRFVLVRGVDRWEGSGGASGSGSEGATSSTTAPLDRLAEYSQAPIDSTCMVLVGDKIDGRRKLATVAKKLGFIVSCDVLDRRELPEWIRTRVGERGNSIEVEVADLLAEIAGPELAYVNDAIERLSLYVGAGEAITEHAIVESIARVRMADTWDLVGKIGARDLAGALRSLAEAYDPRDRGLPLLGAVAWSVRQLAKYQAAQNAGASSDEAARRAGVFQPFRARELAQRVKAFAPRELERWLVVLSETDLALKSSRRPADAILEDMLTRLMGAAKRPATTGARAR